MELHEVLVGSFGAVGFALVRLFGFHCVYALAVAMLLGCSVYLYGTLPHRKMSWIPGPKPSPFYGNLKEIGAEGECFYLSRMAKQYGKLYKLCYGVTNAVVVTDPDLIKEVMVTKFSSFHSRKLTLGSHNSLISQVGDSWRRARRTLNPSFNTINLTKFTDDMNSAGRDMVERLDTLKEGESVEIFRWFGSLTMQVISSTSFGMEIKQADATTSHPLIASIIKILEITSPSQSKGIMMMEMFPFLVKIFKLLPFGPVKAITDTVKVVTSKTNEMISELKSGKNINESLKRSFLNLLVNARDPETGEGLPQREIDSQSFLFILAGYETTATALTFLSYCLAKHQDIQKKLLDEIDANFGDGKLEYSDLKKYKYLDMIIQEVLRLYPPASLATRSTFEDCELGGHKILKGTRILLPIWAVHNSEKNYKDPDVFDPERWNPNSEDAKDRHPFAWIPFTEGPRKCIGYRFALEEIKIAVANVFKHYKFTLSSKTEEPLRFRPYSTLSPINGVYFIPHKR